MHWMYAGRLVPRRICLRTMMSLQSVKNFHYCSCGALNKELNIGRISARRKSVRKLNTQQTRGFSRTAAASIWFFGSKEPALPPAIPTTPVDTSAAAEAASAAMDPAVGGAIADTVANSGVVDAVVTGAIIDPPFVEMGLATRWFPNHLVQQLLEWVHLSSDFPWWATIVVGTVVIRVITLPLYIYTRKYMIRASNHRDELQVVMDKFIKAKNEDNMLKRLEAQHNLKKFYKDTGTGPVKGSLVNISMMSVFMTSIIAVRQMCAVPVPSLTEGGVLWFMNLAAPDSYYALPIITGVVMAGTIHVAMQGGTIQGGAKYAGLIRKVKYLPIIGMPLVFGYASSGVCLYWLTTSVISLGLQRLILLPSVKDALKMPVPVKREPGSQGLKDVFKDWRKDNREKVLLKMARKDILRERKKRAKDRKKELKKPPPVTYTIGVDAKPVNPEIPDFEREWRPPRPKAFGHY